MRKLIEQANRDKRLRETIFGVGSFAEAIKNIELTNRVISGSVAEALKHTVNLKDFNRPWELHAERLRELSAFNTAEYSRIAKILDSSAVGLDESTKAALALAGSNFHDRFRFPAISEMPEFQKAIGEAFTPLRSLHLKIDEIQKTLGTIRAPWLDSLNATRSFGSVANLAALGAAVREAPFALPTIQTVKDVLGTWTPFPAEIESNSVRREEFYAQQGLDKNILAIPEPAFTQVLEATGIVSVELLIPDADSVAFDPEEQNWTSEEAALFGRMGRAASLLQIFEVKLREFIHRAMTNLCGEGWERARLPGNGETYQKWKDKQARAIKNGETQLELICYADFTDYAKVITRGDNWQQLFAEVFADKDDVHVSFRRLEPLRLPPMHARPVTKGDLLTIGTETSRILTAIGVLRRL